MKKTSIFVGALAIISVTALVIACGKDKETKAFQSEETVKESNIDDMSIYLKEFKKKMISTTKGGETLSIDDACWHLEAVLNYTYGNAGYQTSDIQYDTFYYQLNTNNEEVTLSQLNEAFNAISTEVENTYELCNLTNKTILALHTEFVNDAKGPGVVIKTILSTRGLNMDGNSINLWFDSTDYWHELYQDFGGNIYAGGKCGPYVGESPNSGAPLELTRKLNLRIPGLGCPQGPVYYTDIEDGFLGLYGSDFETGFLYDANSPCHYKLYYRNDNPEEPWANNPSRCICPEHMNYYLSKGMELVNHYQPAGKNIISLYYSCDEILGARYGNCFHFMYLQYGIPHCNGGGGDE